MEVTYMLLCSFCGFGWKNENSLRNHQRLCKENPDRQTPKAKTKKWYDAMSTKKGANQYTYGAQMAASTKEKISKASKNQVWDLDRKSKHSAAMKKAVENNPESYTSSNRGRTKQLIVDGVKFQGKWELEFYTFCKDNNIDIERSNEWFEYQWNGTRKYFPDFYLPQKDIYVEVKGYETERDRAKWSNFPKKLTIIRKEDIMNIRNGTFDIGIVT